MNASPASAGETPSDRTRVLRAVFDRAAPYTVGVEEEVMLLSPRDFGLLGSAREMLGSAPADGRFKLELPASQLEIVTAPVASVESIETTLRAARRELAARCAGRALLAAAGTHPFSPGIGALNPIPRYEHLVNAFGGIAGRQLVCALQVHIAAGGADRALSAYNSLRSYLPLIAALAANAPYYEGVDTGFASIRPKLAELLPRQGIPPAFESWESYARVLSWDPGGEPDLRNWWWELRLHPRYGTLELRVPDAQSTVADAVALVALAQCLVAWLGERHDAGEGTPVHPSWRIEENRWSAARFGVEGTMVDLDSGRRRTTRELLAELVDALAPTAVRLAASGSLDRAAALISENGAIAQRRARSARGLLGVVKCLVERFQA